MSEEYIKRSDATSLLVSRLQETAQNNAGYQCDAGVVYADAADRLRLAWINDIPAADVRPVVRGKWIQTTQPMGWRDEDCAECSVCGEDFVLDEWAMDEFTNLMNFCPNCGADMRGES